ncbi:Purple acid phosphatase-like, N-terminal [Sesbania bispinosa]|nr:Purple acid phosphatase-like, N-terminal [Sesbania bispinosa]
MGLVFVPPIVILSLLFSLSPVSVHGGVPTTLDGPFKPVTIPLDQSFRGNAVDLPDTDPLVRRTVEGFEPEQISVSLSASHDSVWISWITGFISSREVYLVVGIIICKQVALGLPNWDNIEPLDPSTVSSIVQYGRYGRSMSHQAVGYSLVYSQLYPFEGLQNYTSGIIHHVRLTGIYNTWTMPASGPKSYPSRIAVVGDLGLTYNTTSTVNHMISNHPDLILLVGDVSYANLYLTNEGNHEIEQQAENKTFVAYSSRFAFPSEESGSSSTFYYSFNAGGIHFIMLGAYISYSKSGEQYKWLESDLASVDREVTPWLVATWHPPWYSTYKAHYREAECMRVEMEDLLYQYGVDIVFNGHVHAYERSNRVYNYKLDPCGPVYITVGDGGNREKMAITHADEPGNCPEPSTTPDSFMVASVPLISHLVQQQVSSAGTDSLIIVLSEKVALVMEF